MMRHILWLAVFLLSLPVWAQGVAYTPITPIAICDGLPTDQVPNFTEVSCRTEDIGPLDPQGHFIWVKGQVTISPETLASGVPLSVFVSAKAATTVYLQGSLLGTNGTPAVDAATEVPGKADAVFPVSAADLKPGVNDIVFAMSAHHGVLTLPGPVTVLLLGPHVRPGDFLLRRYMPTLPLLGMLLLASLYFGAQFVRSREDAPPALLPLATLLATGQLLAEVSRAVIPYPYPIHDLRLSLIILFAAGFGICLLLHVTERFQHSRKILLSICGIGITATVVFMTPSYDDKAAFAIMVPAAIGALIAGFSALRGASNSRLYASLLGLAALGIHQTSSQFLDVYFYYLVGALLLVLFWIEARVLAQARDQRAEEKARADRLQLALDESRERHTPTGITVKSAGSVEMVATDKLAFCKGARDYVELMLNDGSSKLYSGSLTDLEEELPTTFLRVHRSYLVNTAYVDKLERDPSGTGTLTLSTGDKVPVSRRIMPRVRKALA